MPSLISKETREVQLRDLEKAIFVRWSGPYKNSHSKAVMRCLEGHEWSASVHHLINGNRGCPACAGNIPVPKELRERQLAELPGIVFVRWDGAYRGNGSYAVIRCENGHERSASLNNLIHAGVGCPQCISDRYSKRARELQLSSLDNVEFLKWASKYENCDSKAVMRCHEGHEWSASVMNLVVGGTRCPSCAKYGYDDGKEGSLYVLVSKCGHHMKVGISNVLARRMSELKRVTPFEFVLVKEVRGCGSMIRKLESGVHRWLTSSGFSGFNGCTEWFLIDEAILELISAYEVINS